MPADLLHPLTCREEQLNEFHRSGFMKIPQAVPGPVLLQLGDALERIRQQADLRDVHLQGPDGNSYFINAGDLCNRGEKIFAELLGSPLLLSLAETICGPDFFPIQEFAVIKNRGDGNPVNWHQDVNNGAPGKTFMVGIYLDAADEENGALRVVPGSHHSTEPICVLEKMPYVSIPMQPGDILVHDLMVAHSSGLMSSLERRRVIYFEFISSAQALQEAIYPEAFIRLRTRLIPVAMKFFGNACPQAQPFAWNHPQQASFTVTGDLEQEIAAIHNHHHYVKPANYCFDMAQTMR